MLSFTFTVGSADDARLAAEVCDFLSERMTSGAAPSTRRPRAASNKAAVEQSAPVVSDPAPKDAAALYAEMGGTAPVATDVPAVATVADPAALAAALAGGTPVDDRSVASAAQVDPPAVAPKVEPEVAAARLERCRTIAKARGAKWLGDTMRKLKIENSMSTWTVEQQDKFFAEDATA